MTQMQPDYQLHNLQRLYGCPYLGVKTETNMLIHFSTQLLRPFL